MTVIKLFFIFIIKFIISYDEIEEIPNYLKFPFNTKIKSFSKMKLNNSYNEANFLDDFLYNPILINMSIGIPQQRIKVILDQKEKSFIFERNQKVIKYNYEHHNNSNYTQILPYLKNNSISSNKINDINLNYENQNEFNDIYNLEDAFYLYEYADIKNISIKNMTTFLPFLYQNNKGDDEIVYGKIGFDMNNYKDISFPRFSYSLKNKNIIRKNCYYIDFYSYFHGYLYLGNEPHFIEKRNDIYKEYQYIKMNSVLSKEGYVQWNLLFNKIMLKNKTNDYTYNLNEKMSQLDFNLGLIVGTSEYQQFIENNFFNELIYKKICTKSLVEKSYDNDIKKYYIYKCNQTLMNVDNFDRVKYKPYINYFEIFPDIKLFHINFEHNFYISNFDLFRLIQGDYYFLIIFEAEKENNIWKFGQIFLHNHLLVFDYDDKVIGYYDRRIGPPKNNTDKNNSTDNKENKENENKEKEDNQIDDNQITNNKGNNFYIYLIIILSIVFSAIIVVAFFLGMKVKESRRKRANELKDDDYDYITYNNSINPNNIINNKEDGDK